MFGIWWLSTKLFILAQEKTSDSTQTTELSADSENKLAWCLTPDCEAGEHEEKSVAVILLLRSRSEDVAAPEQGVQSGNALSS